MWCDKCGSRIEEPAGEGCTTCGHLQAPVEPLVCDYCGYVDSEAHNVVADVYGCGHALCNNCWETPGGEYECRVCLVRPKGEWKPIGDVDPVTISDWALMQTLLRDPILRNNLHRSGCNEQRKREIISMVASQDIGAAKDSVYCFLLKWYMPLRRQQLVVEIPCHVRCPITERPDYSDQAMMQASGIASRVMALDSICKYREAQRKRANATKT